MKKLIWIVLCAAAFISLEVSSSYAGMSPEERKKEDEQLQEEFKWWPTDAQPAPVKDEERGGYWWWPNKPGSVGPLWGNRGYCYVRKVIFDYKSEELPPPQPQEMRPSLLIKKILKNVKVYFDYDKSELRDDAVAILKDAVRSLKNNPETSILITGNCDMRGSETYNLNLGKQRAQAVKKFMFDAGIAENKVKIVSRGKLDAVSPVKDLVGMQKDRNAQFMIAEVEEIMIPYTGTPPTPEAKPVEEGKYIQETEEQVESEVKVSTKEYTIQKGDTLWKIAQKEYGKPYRWKYLYELNKDVIKNPNKLKAGKKIMIPVE